MGKSAPLLVRGWIEKTGTKRYRLTPKGIDDLRGLEGQDGSASYAKIEQRRAEAIGGLLSSTAFELWKSGNAERITFHQFCRLVGLSAADPWQSVQGKLAQARQLADEARRLGETDQGLRVFYRGRNVSFEAEQLRSLPALLSQLEDRFKTQMQEWKRHATG
jgi:hypothetical protein